MSFSHFLKHVIRITCTFIAIVGHLHILQLNKRHSLEVTNLGPVQSTVNLTSLLVVKILTVLVSTISNSQVFLLKNVSSFFKCKSYSHFFSKNISVYAIFNDQSFVGLGGSVGCAVRLETRRSRVQPPPRSATFFCGD